MVDIILQQIGWPVIQVTRPAAFFVVFHIRVWYNHDEADSQLAQPADFCCPWSTSVIQ